MHHPRTRHHANRRSRRASAPAVHSPDDHIDQPGWADVVAHLLLPTEVVHIKTEASGWRWEPAEVNYDRNLLLFGGPFGMAITGIASTVGNRRARRRAERTAAPAWRPLGALVVIGTDQRLLVWHQGAWWSVWYHAVVDVNPQPCASSLDLRFDTDAPYRLRSDRSDELARLVQPAVMPAAQSRE